MILLVLVGDDCADCDAAIPELNEIAGKYDHSMRVAAVFSGTRKEAMAWRMKHLPAFQVAHASPRALRAYFRTLPTCFLLREGMLVRATWSNTPTSSELEPLMDTFDAEPAIR